MLGRRLELAAAVVIDEILRCSRQRPRMRLFRCRAKLLDERSPRHPSSSAPGGFLSMKCPNAEASGWLESFGHAYASTATRRPCFTIQTLAYQHQI